MKNKPRLILLTAIVTGTLIVALLHFLLSKSMRIDKYTCARIRPGMTQVAVEGILGGPPGDYDTGRREIVIGLTNSGSMEDGRIEEWGGDDGIIQVKFDRRGRVVWADFVPAELWARSYPTSRRWTAIERWLGRSLW